jgi:predicted PurR-regulated permease PerM
LESGRAPGATAWHYREERPVKNFNFNRKYLEISVYTLCVILLALILGKIVWNIVGLGQSLHSFIKFFKGVLAPFIYGFFIAYFMNTTVRSLERVIFKRIRFFDTRPRPKRIITVTLTFVLYLGLVVWIVSYLVPEVVLNISNLLSKLPTDLAYYQRQFYIYLGSDSALAQFLTSLNINLLTSYDLTDIINKLVQPLVGGLVSLTNIVNALLSGTVTFAYSLLNVILGLVIAFYMLCDKEHYQETGKKFLHVLFKRKKRVGSILRLASSSNLMIEKFIVGKAIDSTIIGLIFFLVCMILRPPYALLLTLIVAITNMIPYFGPLVGVLLSTLIVLLASPSQAIWILIITFTLQQFDGMYLGPKILGDSTGLPPILVILAILVGGAVAGVPGMFFGVPVTAIIRNLFTEYLNQRYAFQMDPEAGKNA